MGLGRDSGCALAECARPSPMTRACRLRPIDYDPIPMGEQFPKLDAKHREFIGQQRVFFTASAAPGARVNISPRAAEAFASSRRQDCRLSGQDRQRQRNGCSSQGGRSAHHHVLRLRRFGQYPEALWPRRSPATRKRGIRRAPDNRIRRRGAYRRATDDPPSPRPYEDLLRVGNASLHLPPGAPLARQLGAVSRARTGLRRTGARKTWSVSTVCRPDGLTKHRTAPGSDRRFRVARVARAARSPSSAPPIPAAGGYGCAIRRALKRALAQQDRPCSTFPPLPPPARITPPSSARSSSSPSAIAISRRSRPSRAMSAFRLRTSSMSSSAGRGSRRKRSCRRSPSSGRGSYCAIRRACSTRPMTSAFPARAGCMTCSSPTRR